MIRQVPAAIWCGPFVATLLATTPATATATTATATATATAEVFRFDHDHPETSLPSLAAQTAQPVAFAQYQQELLAEGEAAATAGKQDQAVHFYRALARAAPDRSLPFRKLCGALSAAGRGEEARDACRIALHREGPLTSDFLVYGHLALAQPGPLSPAVVNEIRDAIAHLEAQGDPASVSFAWALAMRQGDRADAQHLFERARALNLAPDDLARMERTMAAHPSGGRVRAVTLPIFALLIAGVVALMLFRPRVPPPAPKPARASAGT